MTAQAGTINGGPLTALHVRADRFGGLPLGQFQVEIFMAHGIPQLAVMGPGPAGPVQALANLFVTPATAGELRSLADRIEAAFPQLAVAGGDAHG